MKKIISLLLLGFTVTSFASTVTEKEIAKCNTFNLIEKTIESNDSEGNDSKIITFEVQSGEERLFADKIELVDKNVYQFVSENLVVSITESLEFTSKGTSMIFRLDGKACVSL